jgi:hypothetical protein
MKQVIAYEVVGYLEHMIISESGIKKLPHNTG